MGLEHKLRDPANAKELTPTGQFGTHVHTCLEPEKTWVGITIDLPEATAIADDSAAAVSRMAASQVQEHLALHQAAGTYPCPAFADPVSAIYKDGTDFPVWMTLDELEA